MLKHRFLYLTGLPCSGVYFLNQLLAQHPDFYLEFQPSPVCDFLLNLRTFTTQNPPMVNRIKADRDQMMKRSLTATRQWLEGWYTDVKQPWIIDYHPHWLQHLELIHLIDPDFRMVVCVRELGQICASIENQHQNTLLWDFSEPLASLSKADRTLHIFSPQGKVGSMLKSLENLQYLDEKLQKCLFYVVYEHLISEPQEVLTELWQWLNLSAIKLESEKIKPKFAYDGDNLGKYQEDSNCITYSLPPRFNTTLKQNFTWFYRLFYPGQL